MVHHLCTIHAHTHAHKTKWIWNFFKNKWTSLLAFWLDIFLECVRACQSASVQYVLQYDDEKAGEILFSYIHIRIKIQCLAEERELNAWRWRWRYAYNMGVSMLMLEKLIGISGRLRFSIFIDGIIMRWGDERRRFWLRVGWRDHNQAGHENGKNHELHS